MSSDYLFDRARAERIGLDEAVFCGHKTPQQIAEALMYARAENIRMLLTRLDPDKAAKLPRRARSAMDYDPDSRTGIVGRPPPVRRPSRIAIVTGGTSDSRVALEASRTLRYYGEAAAMFSDVGVTGLWRLLDRLKEIAAHPVVIAVAGMEGALFNVLGGLIKSVVIAVPTSTGYGVAAGGGTALAAALGGCAPGIVAVNIDNGYGAACAALRALDLSAPASRPRGGPAGPKPGRRRAARP